MAMRLDDGDLLLAWRTQRDEAAFRELCRRHASLVAAICRRLGSPDPDEATQAVFLVLARRAGSVAAASLACWLGGTARRVVAHQRRAVRRRRQHEQEAAMEHARRTDAAPIEPAWAEAREHLDAALASLSTARREAVLRFYLEGSSQAEVAAALGCSEGAVKTRVHEGLERLRAFFARKGVALGAAALASGLAGESAAAEPALAASCAEAAFLPASAPGAAALATGVTTAMFLKTAALVATGFLLAGSVITVALIAAEAPPPLSASAPPTAGKPAVAAVFSSRAWRCDEASGDLARVGVKLHLIGGWKMGKTGWAIPADIRRKEMPPAAYIRAWAAAWRREVLMWDDGTIAVIGTRQELERLLACAGDLQAHVGGRHDHIGDLQIRVGDLQARAGERSSRTILAALDPKDGFPPAEQPDRPVVAALRTAFQAAEGPAKLDAAIELCATGDDAGLAFVLAALPRLRDDIAQAQDAGSKNTLIVRQSSAIKAVGQHGGVEALRSLAGILQGAQLPVGTYQEANAAAVALCVHGGDEAIRHLARALLTGNAAVAFAAACGLECLGGQAGLQLASLAYRSAEPKVRRAGLFGAYRANGEGAVPLLRLAKDDPDEGVRRMVMTGLTTIGTDEATALLRTIAPPAAERRPAPSTDF